MGYLGSIQDGIWKVFGEYLGGIWRVLGGSIAGVFCEYSEVFRRHLGHIRGGIWGEGIGGVKTVNKHTKSKRKIKKQGKYFLGTL